MSAKPSHAVGPTLPAHSVAVPAPAAHAPVQDAVRRGVESPSQALAADVRGPMEERLGHDFAGIRIHCGPAAATSARALGAQAYVVDEDIVFDAGRYDPGSREGQHLLAHELAHHAHLARAPERRSGIAPEDSSAERLADQAAEHVTAGSAVNARAPDLWAWGPAWAVHRQVDKIAKKGTVKHTGEVGASTGSTRKPTGTVEVRTGEDVDLKGGGKLPNTIAITYAGALSADSKWLQFVWFEMTATEPAGTAHYNGDLQIVGSGKKALTTDPKNPDWSIDTTSASDPFYEAGFANLRTKNSTTIFDVPGGGVVQPLADAIYASGGGATSVTFTAHFETYLIQKNATVYGVAWQASTAFSQVKGRTIAAAIGYSIGTSGPRQGLPAARKTLLDTTYPKLKQIR